jgi:hypothetical protein
MLLAVQITIELVVFLGIHNEDVMSEPANFKLKLTVGLRPGDS